MRNVLNPRWLFIINTLPIAVLMLLFYGQFNIIKTLLDEDCIYLWQSFALKLGVLGLLNLAYTVYLTFKRKNVSVGYGILALLCYITLMYLYMWNIDSFFPFTVPQWMISGNLPLYVFTFLMPTLAYSLFVLVAHFTPEIKEHKAWVNFLIAIAIPAVGYLLTVTDIELWIDNFNEHILFIFAIVATVVFLFFLVRSIFILATKKAALWQKYQLAWKIPIAIVLPIVGLLVNNGNLFGYRGGDGGIFGDFSSPWFYILAILNGILICLPNFENKLYRLFLFIGRSVTFVYTLYFFLVFLPFLPLSVVAIVAVGAGFLMLTPLLLFVIHINEMAKDFSYLKTLFSKKLIIVISALSFFIIPACITATYLKDKSVLNQTLTYLYTPDYSKNYNINKKSLQKTLNVIKHHKERGNFLSSDQMPYLSSYFNWLVLDNLTLSDAKINYIEKVFFGQTTEETWTENIQNENVNITKVSTTSTYDTSQNAWKSWVDLEITNSGNAWRAEYATTIDLPEGCWISDYYLYVDSVKESGILAEKRSAMWIFSQIRGTNRDPGILHYLTGNKVAFRIFPFVKEEVRRTGIEFLHKEPVKLNIDNHIVELGNTEETVYENVETENFIYLSSQYKQTLKQVHRQPYYHFLVDMSKGYENLRYVERIEQFLAGNTAYSENAKISFVNSYVYSYPFDDHLWAYNKASHIPYEGGFFLDRAVKMALLNTHKDKYYPIIVVVSDSIQNAVLDKDFSDFKFAFPEYENDLFFILDESGNYSEYSLLNNDKEAPIIKRYCRFCIPALEYQLSDSTFVYLPNDGNPSIILKKDIFEIKESDIKEKDWQSALAMQAKWMSQILHPETSDKAWLNLVKCSFKSKVVTPVTSYMVVENEAQKAMLKKKQEQALSSNQSLDLGEDTQAMSEPSLWILAFLFGIVLWGRKIWKK